MVALKLQNLRPQNSCRVLRVQAMLLLLIFLYFLKCQRALHRRKLHLSSSQ